MNMDALQSLAVRQLPRMLTQVSRDPLGADHGCWDRDWWHYKIRDFPSIILQQGGYAMWLASNLPCCGHLAGGLRGVAAASARFWNHRAMQHGAFEEYYPFEQGYPPVAFSTLAMAKLARDGGIPIDDIRPGLEIAVRQLLSRFEDRAANQQLAGTAALAVVRAMAPDLVGDDVFHGILDRTMAMQDPEGWFPEYDGPDLGYLSVSMDCLYDIHDATGDPRCLIALDRALDFIAWFVLHAPHAAGMLNARNTDYLVPYALARMAVDGGNPSRSALAAAVFSKLFGNADAPGHFFAAIDDRYWCHYTGQSLFRALGLAAMPPVCRDDHVEIPARRNWPGCGLGRIGGDANPTAMIAARKGGAVQFMWSSQQHGADYGWRVARAGRDHVSHWWNHDWRFTWSDNSVVVDGALVGCRDIPSSPWKHVVLRGASWLCGRRLITGLKNLFIFRKDGGQFTYHRTVRVDADEVVIEDSIDGVGESDEIRRAPRASKRHVASADSYHPEDFDMLHGVTRDEHITRHGRQWQCVTIYRKAQDRGNPPVEPIQSPSCT